LTALLHLFRPFAERVCDLAGIDAGLLHRLFHGFGRLLKQIPAIPLALGPCPLAHAQRQLQHSYRTGQRTNQKAGPKGPHPVGD
jgi:hypothetical protein